MTSLATLSNSIVPVTNGSGVITSSSVTATELNILDGLTATTAELNIMDGTATTQESVPLAGTDGVVISDEDVMKQCLVSDFGTYIASASLTLINKTLTAPKFASGGFIADSTGAKLIKFSQIADAVNEITVTNADTNIGPSITASGTDTNIDLSIGGKGTGSVIVNALKIGNTANSTIGPAAVSGTNTAGKALIIHAGAGTGTGAGGNIVFQVADGGAATSSNANNLVPALTIADDKTATFGGNVVISAGNLTIDSTVVNTTASELNSIAGGSKTQKYVYAAPNGSDGPASFRALVASDIPLLNQNTTGTAATVTNGAVTTVKIADGAVTTVKIADGAVNLTTNVTGLLPIANGGGFTTALKDKLDGLSSSTVNATGTLASAGTYMVNASSNIDITLPDSAIGSIITLYGIGSSAYNIKGTTINGTTLSGTQYVLAGANTATVCIATGTSAWVVYVSGVHAPIVSP